VVTARMIHVRRIRYRLEYGHDERSTVPISAIPPWNGHDARSTVPVSDIFL